MILSICFWISVFLKFFWKSVDLEPSVRQLPVYLYPSTPALTESSWMSPVCCRSCHWSGRGKSRISKDKTFKNFFLTIIVKLLNNITLIVLIQSFFLRIVVGWGGFFTIKRHIRTFFWACSIYKIYI